MRNLLIVLFFCALGAFAAQQAQPTDLDSLFRGREYKPQLNSSLRDTTKMNDVSAKSTKGGKSSDGYYMLQFEAVGDFDAAQRRRAQISIRRSTNFVAVDGQRRKRPKTRHVNFLPTILTLSS